MLGRSDTCGLLQKPMTSLMLVMSQHIVHYIFHEDFCVNEESQQLFMNFQCNFILPLLM